MKVWVHSVHSHTPERVDRNLVHRLTKQIQAAGFFLGDLFSGLVSDKEYKCKWLDE